jgi:DNA ligase-associated metallophosphoesterase
MRADVFNEEFELWPQRAIYWKRINTLLLADLHIGKINHFRKSGIPVPTQANDKNIEVLIDLIHRVKPSRVICLGDLFHSHYNPEWEVFGEVVKHFKAIAFELVLGNHDIMSERQYERKGICVFDELLIEKFIFTHHPLETIALGHYNIAGHIHPGVVLQGKGRQALTLPCFHFGKQQGLLPAFGAFTGLAKIRPKKNDQVFVIADDRIFDIKKDLDED